MKTLFSCSLVTCVCWFSICNAIDLTFHQPDGTPAPRTMFYQTYVEAGDRMGMGMDMMMGGGGYGDMGGGMEEYGSEGDEMMMGMGDMLSRPPRNHPQDDISFLNGAPLQTMNGSFGIYLESAEYGKI